MARFSKRPPATSAMCALSALEYAISRSRLPPTKGVGEYLKGQLCYREHLRKWHPHVSFSDHEPTITEWRLYELAVVKFILSGGWRNASYRFEPIWRHAYSLSLSVAISAGIWLQTVLILLENLVPSSTDRRVTDICHAELLTARLLTGTVPVNG